MKNLILFCLLFTLNVYSQEGSSLLLKDNKGSIDLTSRLVKQKTFNLDNAYKVQLFGSWKAARINNKKINHWVELVLDDKLYKSFVGYPLIYNQAPTEFRPIMESTLAYLQWQLELSHSFLNQWLKLSANSHYLETELGMALDHVIAKSATNWILKNGLILTPEQNNMLSQFENAQSSMNYALQAWKNQRKGERSLKWVNKLDNNDPLRIQLIYTAITDYANRGKLALSGQLIKKAIEPYIEKSEDEKEISFYYLTLGRLLYQARAYDAANEYYSLIPQTSQYFLQSRVEASWTYIQAGDIANAKGDLATLNLDMFTDKFIPDVFLTNAIVNLKTCQFEEVQKNLNRFVEVNKKWAKIISKNLVNKNAKMIDWNVYTNATKKHRKSLINESERLASIFNKETLKISPTQFSFYQGITNEFSISRKNLEKYVKNEIHNQWENRQKMLEDAIYRMKFVRIEFLSQMRNLALNIPLSHTDRVSTYNAAPSRNNELAFPNDGDLWGDDLFHMRAAVKNLCLKGLKK